MKVDLSTDCSRCCALCCVAPHFDRSEDFAFTKPAHVACRHLSGPDFGCSIHDELGQRGFPGCAAYDCHGAGNFVTQEFFGGRTWRDLADPRVMFEVFMVARQLFDQLALLQTALQRADDRQSGAIRGRIDELQSQLATPAERFLTSVDAVTEETRTRQVLRRLGVRSVESAIVRLPTAPHPDNHGPPPLEEDR